MLAVHVLYCSVYICIYIYIMSIICHISVSDHHRRLSSSTSSDSPSIDLKCQSSLLKKSHAIDKILHQLYNMIQSISNQKHSRTILYKHFAQDIIFIQFIHPGKIDTKKHDCPNQPRHPWYVGLLPEAGVLRKRLPKTVSTRKVWKSERTSLSSPKTSTWRVQGLGEGALGGGYLHV